MKSISGKEMCKVLQRHGWQLDRISGSHHIFNKLDVPNQVFDVFSLRGHEIPIAANRMIE